MSAVRPDCCPPDALPAQTTVHCSTASPQLIPPAEEYVQLGNVTALGDLPVYVVGTTPSLSAVIVGYDIYGFEGGRIRQLCDELSMAGHLVILPDYFRGDAWTAQREAREPDLKVEWIKSLAEPDKIRMDLKLRIIPFLRNQGVAKIGYFGFCFGGYVTFLGCQEGDVACGVGMHSALKIFNMYGSNERNAASKVTCPQLIIQGHNDPENSKPNGTVHEELLKHSFGTACSLHEFAEVAHGWVPRGDLKDAVVAKNVRDAMDLGISFLNKHLLSDITCCCPVPLST